MLSTPITIKNMKLKNRLVMPPMATSRAAADGTVTQQILNDYGEKSAGGCIGLIIMEHSYVSMEGKAGKGQLSIAEDKDIEGLRLLSGLLHKNGSRVMAQLSHAGGAARSSITGKPVLGACAVKMPGTEFAPAEMSCTDIQKVIADFTAAALRAKAAGFDGVELHSAHGYLLNQFYSPLTNRRTGCCSGETLEGRLQLHTQIIASVRAAVGEDYTIGVRLGACDYMPGGSSIQDAVSAAVILEQAGADLLDISGGFCGYIRPGADTQGYFSEISQLIKEAVRIPVILTGGITEPDAAEWLLTHQKADLIGVGRALLKDSCWAKKAFSRTQNTGTDS